MIIFRYNARGHPLGPAYISQPHSDSPANLTPVVPTWMAKVKPIYNRQHWRDTITKSLYVYRYIYTYTIHTQCSIPKCNCQNPEDFQANIFRFEDSADQHSLLLTLAKEHFYMAVVFQSYRYQRHCRETMKGNSGGEITKRRKKSQEKAFKFKAHQNPLNAERSESSSNVSTGKSEWLHLCGAGYVPESQDTTRAIE